MDAGAQNEAFDEALVMELLSRAAAEAGGQPRRDIKLAASARDLRRAARLFVLEAGPRRPRRGRKETRRSAGAPRGFAELLTDCRGGRRRPPPPLEWYDTQRRTACLRVGT